MFIVNFHDHYDHCRDLGEFDTLTEARAMFNNLVKMSPEPADYAYEIVDDTDGDYETIEFTIVQEVATV